ncbi:MAG: hypothetical protein O3A01_07800 [bacterium]|nr:hypothetical protein [bacterium]
MKRFFSSLNILSAIACFIIGTVLTLELGFVVSEENRLLFQLIHRYLLVYFAVDLCLRFLFMPHRKQVFIRRFMDFVIVLPFLPMIVPKLGMLDSYLVIQGVLLTVLVGRLSHINVLFKHLHFNPAQIFLLGFVLAIFVGALLLSLPIAHKTQTVPTFLDALFIATSAVCVTGLATLDIGSYYSGFGQLVILILIQLGGLGIMTFYVLLTLMLNKKLSHNETREIQESFMSSGSHETGGIIRQIVTFTLGFELLGALLLYIFWQNKFASPLETLYYAVFHSISAYCNAGFSLFSDSLGRFATHSPTLLIISALIILGGIGFPVMLSLFHHDYDRFGFSRFRLQTKLPILVSAVLIVIGLLVILLGEYATGLAGYSLSEKIMLSLFHSVSARTAGFSAMDISVFGPATLWIVMLLMFIGASPGSTGGGIKTSTFGVLMVALWETMNGRQRIELFGRTISTANVFKAISIIVVSALVIMVFFYILLVTEAADFMGTYFETISAFGTVGLSLGMTPFLSEFGKIAVIGLMFVGRVGPLTVAFALSRRKSKPNYKFPEERILLG